MRVVLITGASSGIGEATAERFAKEPDTTLVLVARREDRLEELAARLPAPASVCAVDLTADDAPAAVRQHVEQEHGGRLDVLVNNAGAAWRGTFASKGHENVRRHMELNFDAVLRLTEALLPLLHDSAPGAAIVNVGSTAGKVARGGSGGYSASKFALAGWSDALALEERAHGVHVGQVLPGFIATEGFPQAELTQKAATRWAVSTPDVVAEAILQCAQGKPERYVPRPYALAAVLRVLTPGLARRILGGSSAKLTPASKHGAV